MDQAAPATTVADEIEGDLVCGLLRAAGIECGLRRTGPSDTPFGGVLAGRIEVLVHASDLEAARAVLAAADSPGGADAPA